MLRSPRMDNIYHERCAADGRDPGAVPGATGGAFASITQAEHQSKTGQGRRLQLDAVLRQHVQICAKTLGSKR